MNSYTYDGGRGYDWNGENAWKATWTGAVAGGVSGGLGGTGWLGDGMTNAFGTGFAGGATGAYLNGASSRNIWKAGFMGGAMSLGGYALSIGINNYLSLASKLAHAE